MNSSLYRPKRELSPLQRACVSLGMSADTKPKTYLARLLRKTNLGKTAIDYLAVSRDEQAQQIAVRYHGLNATEQKAVTIDHLLMATGADEAHIWGCINAELYRMTRLLIWENAPDVMKKTIERAKTRDAYQDRRLFFQAVRVLTVPRR